MGGCVAINLRAKQQQVKAQHTQTCTSTSKIPTVTSEFVESLKVTSIIIQKNQQKKQRTLSSEDPNNNGQASQKGEQNDIFDESLEELSIIAENQYISGAIIEQKNFSTVMIYNSKVCFEFELPKKQAGPLITPFLEYTVYQL